MSYFNGQGEVHAALRDSTGQTGGFLFLGDVSQFKVDFTQKFDDVRENTSGQRQIAAHILTESEGKISLTMQEWSVENILRALCGTTSGAITAGTVTGAAIKAYAGSSTFLDHQNVSAVVVHSGGTALVENTDYTVDLAMGKLTWLAGSTVVTGTSAIALTVDYGYAASAGTIEGLMTGPVEVILRFDGFNIADANSRVSAVVWRAVLDLPKDLSFIDSKHSELQLTGMMLQDKSRGAGKSAFFSITKQND